MKLNNVLYKYIFYLTLKVRREWFIPYLAYLEESQYWSKTKIENLQIKKLNLILSHAKKNVKYYNEYPDAEIKSLKDIQEIPFLDKDDIRKNQDKLTWRNGINQRTKTSGGSTGAPITILKDSSGMALELAATWRGYRWAGIQIGQRQARFWGVPRNFKEKLRASLIDFVCNRKRITAFNYDEKYFEKAFEDLEKFNPDYFYGYVSIIKEFCAFLDKRGLRLSCDLISVITTSEVLSTADRAFISRVLGTNVFDEYGCGEIGTIAHECEMGRLHLNSENIIVEVIDENGNPQSEGVPGEIVVTDLTNFSMPMVRYRLKDWGVLSSDICECGRNLPILDNVFGRQYDTLRNSSGKRFHGEFFLYIAEDAKKMGYVINGIQFLQNASLDIEIRVVCEDSDFEGLHSHFKDRLRKDFDTNINISVIKVDKIERELSGKIRVVKGC